MHIAITSLLRPSRIAAWYHSGGSLYRSRSSKATRSGPMLPSGSRSSLDNAPRPLIDADRLARNAQDVSLPTMPPNTKPLASSSMTVTEGKKRRLLEQEIEDFFQRSQPSEREKNARNKMIDRVQRAIDEVEARGMRPINGYTVFPFGSTLTGIDVSGSDLDLCIVDHDRPHGWQFKTSKMALPGLYNMGSLAYVLRKRNFLDIIDVRNASVPIVKFAGMQDIFKIKADVNTNEQLGLLNSQLIAAYCNLAPMIRRILVFIKHWAKQRDLNDPACEHGPASFNSYTFTLMFLAYLQHAGVLPNLQSPERTAKISRRFFWSRPRDWTKAGHQHDVTWSQPTSEDELIALGVSLRSALEGFFDFFANEFDADEHIISIVRGGVVSRNSQDMVQPARRLTPSPVDWEDEGQIDGDEQILYEGDSQTTRHATLSMTDEELQESERQEDYESDADRFDEGPPAAIKAMQHSWPHPFICQDPFMLERNTATNVERRTFDRFLGEVKRAHELILASASLKTICAPIWNEPAYLADQREREMARRPQNAPLRPPSARRTALPVERSNFVHPGGRSPSLAQHPTRAPPQGTLKKPRQANGPGINRPPPLDPALARFSAGRSVGDEGDGKRAARRGDSRGGRKSRGGSPEHLAQRMDGMELT